ncbi:MAG: hypothetical protein ACREHV_14695, partial [Rhizomicrobium sp.]
MKPANPIPANTGKAQKTRQGCMVALLGLVAAFVIIVAIVGSDNSPPTPIGSGPHGAGCNADWTKCADNADLVNNYEGWSLIQVECQEAANKEARYGTPKWPGLA